VIEPLFTLTSEEICWQFIGQATANKDRFIVLVEGAGGVDLFINGHEKYQHMNDVHRGFCVLCYGNLKVREAVGNVKTTVEAEGITAKADTKAAWYD
jgi:hypothetical protein